MWLRSKGLERREMKRRLQQVLHQLSNQDSNKPVIHRHFLRRGVLKHTIGFSYEETNDIPKEYLMRKLLSMLYPLRKSEQALRKTGMAMDTIKTLKSQGRTLYGLVD